jgi:integrating conjugative element protein (TIGR03765 family)
MRCWLVLVSILLHTMAVASPKLEVIYDSGKTFSVAPYFNGKTKFEDLNAPSDIDSQPEFSQPQEFGFPLQPILWKIQAFQSKHSGLKGLPHTFFIVGCDSTSLDWMRQRRARLLELNSLGLVVACESRETFIRLRRSVSPLILQPMQGDDLALKLNHFAYPALITKTSIEQ